MQDTFQRDIHYLRLSVTDRCNLRCRYCMPAEGTCKREHREMMAYEEIEESVRAAAELGITKLRVTGGEPLVRKGIVDLCGRLSMVPGIGELCMTTNGTLLKQYAPELKCAGVKRLNISLDTLRPERYAYITRIGTLADALEGLETALATGFERIKINTVLIGGFNDDEIGDLARLSVRYPVDVRFIELMPMRDIYAFSKDAYVSNGIVLERLAGKLEPVDSDGVAKRYRLSGAQGKVGLISPVSSRFCSSCNRIRLTADGRLKPCLHSAEEICILGKSFEEKKELFRKAILAKPGWHDELNAEHPSCSVRNMNEIGG